jgi:TctA family transporter
MLLIWCFLKQMVGFKNVKNLISIKFQLFTAISLILSKAIYCVGLFFNSTCVLLLMFSPK